MDGKKIREYAEIMREMDLTFLEVQEEGTSVHLERNRNVLPMAEPLNPGKTEGTVQSASEPELAQPLNEEECITSPMVGMFYIAPAEDADPFVQVGDKVKAGDTVCIIEAMKLMNEIVADKDGVIAEVLAANGTIVEFGQPLFRIRKES